MRLLALPLLFTLSGCIIPIPVGSTTGTPGATAAQPVSENAAFAQAFAQARGQQGLPALVADAGLTRAAQAHARDMRDNDYFSHTSQDGRRLTQRARAEGVCHGTLAENIAMGIRSEQAVVDGWMGSPGHRSNMLLTRANAYGLGRAGDIWVLVVARRC